jgi:hypothetical protein
MEALADYGSSSSDENEGNATFPNDKSVKHGREREGSGSFVVPVSSQKISSVLFEQEQEQTYSLSMDITDDKLLKMKPVRIPRPILSYDKKNNENKTFSYDLSLFDKDYCTIIMGNHRSHNQNEEDPCISKTETNKLTGTDGSSTTLITNDALEKKLDKLYQALGDEDFSSHLKKQKDFTNPSIFPKVIDYFHIDGSGSNLPKETWDPKDTFKAFEFIEKLTASEERAARSRAAATALEDS